MSSLKPRHCLPPHHSSQKVRRNQGGGKFWWFLAGAERRTGESDITVLRQATVTESTGVLIWRRKNLFRRFKVWTMIERSKKRFTSILTNKNKLGVYKGGWQLRWRRGINMVRWRNGDSFYCCFNLVKKTGARKFKTVQEFSRDVKSCIDIECVFYFKLLLLPPTC